MPDEARLVTVGIPTYNRRDGLVRAVESVLAQDYGPIDVVVCDNASSDGTGEAIAELAARHPSVRYLRQERNVGPTANFNRVATEARGGYFMWLGDDDWLDPGYVGACVGALEADPDAVLAAGTAVYHRGDEVVRHGVAMNLGEARPQERVASYFRLVEENGVFYGVSRTGALRQALPIRNEMGGDWFVIARLACLGRVTTLPAVVVHRSVGGATRSLREVARTSNLGRFQAGAPQVALAAFALRDVGWGSPVYARIPTGARAVLAARSAAIVTRRFLPGALRKWARQRASQDHGSGR